MESKFEWENVGGGISILVEIRVVGETNFLNVVCVGSKLVSEKV